MSRRLNRNEMVSLINAKRKVSEPVKDYVSKRIKNLGETKNLTTQGTLAVGSAQTNWSGTVINMNPIAQGDNINDRTGNIIQPSKLAVKLDWNQAIAVTKTAVRTIVFRSKQQVNNTTPTVAQVLASTGTGYATCCGYTSSSESNKAYDILYDKTICMDIYGDGQRKHQRVNLIKKVNDRLIHFTGSGANDYGKGNLFMLLISDQDTATSPSVNYSLQVYYKDN